MSSRFTVRPPAAARPFSRRSWLSWCLATLLLLTTSAASGEITDHQIAYRVKVGFLFNFLRFAEWPETVLPAGAPFRLAIAADDPTYTLVAHALSGKKVKGRLIQPERAGEADLGAPPHLLFVTKSAGDAESLWRQFTAAPVLTVGETEGFARHGGILNFVLVDDAVRFEVNLAAAQRAGVRISSRVSRMAILVRP